MKTLTVEILETDDDGSQRVIITLRLEDGSFHAEATPGAEAALDDILHHICMDPNTREKVAMSQDVERWMKLLPANMTGTYCSARLIL